MPSPFPGMDPFIDDQEWTDFHTAFVTVLREMLAPQLRPRYVARVERRVYVEHLTGDVGHIAQDLAVLDRNPTLHASTAASRATTAPAPVECILPMPEEKREAFLVIRAHQRSEVVTVLELLSPTNKTRGADGFREYLRKRETVLQSTTHLVELDLLRGGERLPVLDELPPGDYYAFVCRRGRRPAAEVWPWTIRDRLPTIPIPLAAGDPEVDLDLQTAFTTTYDRAVYEDSLDYAAELRPPLTAADEEWARELLRGRRSREKR